jgi:hypothetical protein
MTSVPWIRLYTSFFDHPKTRKLRRILGTVEPIQRLWCWAGDCCPTGDLSGQSVDDIEDSAHWRGERGKAYAAMIECGFLDVDGESVTLHGWMDGSGEGVERLTKHRVQGAARQKRYREAHGNALPNGLDNPSHNARPLLSSPLSEIRSDPDPESRPPNEHGKPTARNVVDMYLRLRAEIVVGYVQGANGIFQNPQPGDVAKASEWLASVAPDECADIEPAIRLACKHVAAGAQGWARPEMAKVGYLFGCIVRSWPDLREELHGCSPKLKTCDRNGKLEREPEVTPIREW